VEIDAGSGDIPEVGGVELRRAKRFANEDRRRQVIPMGNATLDHGNLLHAMCK
jgi:hypothetical protein